MLTLDIVLLALTAAFCLWLAAVGVQRRQFPGAATFGWLMLAVTIWTGLSAVHRLPLTIDTRVILAQFQVVGIVSVAPLWFLFGRHHARAVPYTPTQGVLFWVIPVLVIADVMLQGTQGWYWTGVDQRTANPADGLEYVYGPLFWTSVVYSYGLILGGTWMILRSLRDSPPQYRSQVVALALASTVPLVANALYLARVTGDYTPMAFAFSGGVFGWSLFSRYLLNVMPMARGMLFDRFVDAVFVLDADYHVLDKNAAARTLAGDVPPGRPIAQVLPWWDRLINGDTRQADGPSVIRHDARVLDVGVTPLNSQDGHLVGWLVVVRDITDRLRAEDERVALDRRLQEQQHTESLTLLAGGLAHDFNNLLAGIMGNADMLTMRLPPEARELREMAHAITVGSERAADLVAKMLAYAGEGAGPAEPVDIEALAREMGDLLRASVARRTRLLLEVVPTPQVMADATQVRQVILNLVVNACEAIDDTDDPASTTAQVILRTGVERLPASPRGPLVPTPVVPAGQYVFLEVEDSGAGMSADTVARMFDPFFTTKTTGRGLGLASVQGIVRQHHGAFAVHSIEGRGTTVRVWFPGP
ncbi:MAG: ATP-binding protein [Acidobacteria bacterium]|nr:ATP-binding protein [Acidobacteriota bacterium]